MSSQTLSPHVTALTKLVRTQLMRMCMVVTAIALLVVYARHFIWEGVLSNIYLNGLIIALFAFGIALSFKRVWSVRNDALAFAALEEAASDMRAERTGTADDPYWRHYRAMTPGIVFSPPKSIGHMFDLAYDEVIKNKNFQISATTLQNITNAIDGRLADERSLVNYLTGLLIFLGLIGTFVGLMEMVGSIGSVISNLTNVGGNPTETMQRLLTDLQKPLSGMAMGFSSSLFGLFGSLAIGLLARGGTRCQKGLQNAFEGWLANTAHLETGKGGEVGDLARLIADNLMGTPGEKGSGGGGGAGVSDLGMVATMAQGFSRMQTSMEQMNTLLPRMVEAQGEQLAVMRQVLATMDRVAVDLNDTRDSTREAVVVSQTGNESLQEIIQLTRTTEQRLTSGFNGMAHVMEVTGQAYLDGLRRLTAENYETNARLAKLLDVKAAGDKIAEIAGSIESKVRGGVTSMSASMDRTAEALETGMTRLAAEQAELKQVLINLQANASGSGVSAEFEDKLTSGFTELSRSMETVFAAYAQIVNRSLVANAMGGDIPASAPVLPNNRPGALPEHEVRQSEPKPDIDHDALRRKLYSAARMGLRDGTEG
jgi:hypothetical protein